MQTYFKSNCASAWHPRNLLLIIIHAHLQVKPDQEHVFLKESKILLQETRAEEGNISYDLMKSTE